MRLSLSRHRSQLRRGQGRGRPRPRSGMAGFSERNCQLSPYRRSRSRDDKRLQRAGGRAVHRDLMCMSVRERYDLRGEYLHVYAPTEPNWIIVRRGREEGIEPPCNCEERGPISSRGGDRHATGRGGGGQMSETMPRLPAIRRARARVCDAASCSLTGFDGQSEHRGRRKLAWPARGGKAHVAR